MTLCVVDMQAQFSAYRKVLSPVLKEIRRAKKKREGIVVLEIPGCGSTHPKILKALKKYDRVAWASKHGEDGSDQFVAAAKRKSFWLGKIRLCGVNTCQCVSATMSGLRRGIPKAKLEACIDAMACHHNGSASKQCKGDYKKLKYCKLV